MIRRALREAHRDIAATAPDRTKTSHPGPGVEVVGWCRRRSCRSKSVVRGNSGWLERDGRHVLVSIEADNSSIRHDRGDEVSRRHVERGVDRTCPRWRGRDSGEGEHFVRAAVLDLDVGARGCFDVNRRLRRYDDERYPDALCG